MPGARLSHDDRRSIAEWLAVGVPYSEIGRRLGRPTSTISREVARNGFGTDYRADDAQRATATRARRRGPSLRADPEPEDRVRTFVDEFAAVLAATGMPRMPARVFTSLIASESGSMTAAELVQRQGVSPASVSKAIAYLEAMDLVTRAADPGGRRERYLIGDDVWQRAWRTDTSAHTDVAASAARGAELVGTNTAAGARLAEMSRFFGMLSEQMDHRNLADATASDALTVVAALACSARPLTVGELAAALGWPTDRAADALRAIRREPSIADPFELRSTGPETHAVAPRSDRLTRGQLEALRASGPHAANTG